MDLSWLKSILYGAVAGLTDILPVSAQAHRALFWKVFGVRGDMELLDLMTHLAVLGALYFGNQKQLIRFSRARALARVPKRKRRRPLDTRSLMDIRMLRTMLVPVILGMLLYRFTAEWKNNLMVLAGLLLVNGLILYIPQFLPTSNRDSRTLSPVEGLLMGLGGGLAVLPGISSIGAATSIGSICGVERSYGLNMAFLMHMGVTIGWIVYDILAIAAAGIAGVTFGMFLRFVITSGVTFVCAVLAMKLMRYLAANHNYTIFGLYCFGQALFTFILNLMA